MYIHDWSSVYKIFSINKINGNINSSLGLSAQLENPDFSP